MNEYPALYRGGCFDMNEKSTQPAELDVVALLTDLPTAGLARGQVGTVVDTSGEDAVLVEFSDDDGRAYAIVRCPAADLLVLHYEPEAAA
jgi:hypothetical protein